MGSLSPQKCPVPRGPWAGHLAPPAGDGGQTEGEKHPTPQPLAFFRVRAGEATQTCAPVRTEGKLEAPARLSPTRIQQLVSSRAPNQMLETKTPGAALISDYAILLARRKCLSQSPAISSWLMPWSMTF